MYICTGRASGDDDGPERADAPALRQKGSRGLEQHVSDLVLANEGINRACAISEVVSADSPCTAHADDLMEPAQAGG